MHESLLQVIFYSFAGLAILSAVMVITQNNPVRCVLFLVQTFFAMAILWLLAEAEFLALILILVYVGAVMTLFLFVVMMLNIDSESVKKHFMRHLPFGLIVVALLTGLLMVVLPPDAFTFHPELNVEQVLQSALSVSELIVEGGGSTIRSTTSLLSNTEALGMVLYTQYVYAFELAAVILLVAIIAAITLAHRGYTRSIRQNCVEQIMTRPEDRVTLVKMKSEK